MSVVTVANLLAVVFLAIIILYCLRNTVRRRRTEPEPLEVDVTEVKDTDDMDFVNNARKAGLL